MLTPLIMKLEHFLPLPEIEIEWLDSLVLHCDDFPARTDIIREGDVAPTGMFVVIDGHGCRYKILADGKRQILDCMFPGDMTELGALLLKAADHGIFCLGHTTIARLDRDRLLGEMIDHSHAVVALWWTALQRQAILRERIAAIGRRSAYAKIANLLCEIFERLKLVGETVDQSCQLPLTQLELGDALGISEVHANRMLHRLQRERLIAIEHRTLTIPDLEALKAAAEFSANYLHLLAAPQAVRDRLLTQYRLERGGIRA